jgi:tetratricopeptide (TPR) repeat protein
MAEGLELPDEIFGFGSWLLWMIATRAPDLVDRVYEKGRARPSRVYGLAGSHHVPTPSLVAWLLLAAELNLPPDELPQNDALDRRQQTLRTLMSRALSGEPQLFRDSWLHQLAAMCRFSDEDLSFLLNNREEPYESEEAAGKRDAKEKFEYLRRAIMRTLEMRSAAGQFKSTTGALQPSESLPPAKAAPAPRTLPRDTQSFTGRDAQLRRLDIETAAVESSQVAMVYSIGGLAGVGKTAFAVHAAHRLAPRFPDGQIFLPLHGHTPGQKPADPADAIATLLQICGFAATSIPADLEARVARWRDYLADRRMLLVYDDALDPKQVRSLLPGSGGSLVLITSRQHLIDLEDTKTLSLDVLDAHEATGLLIKLANRPDLTPDDPAASLITEQCSRLPLAIGLLARQLHHHPAWTAAHMADDLAAAQNRLDLLEAGSLSVAAAFDLSYADLTADQQRLFRLLGLHPGTDVDSYAAAALDGTDVATARRCLIALYEHYLLTETSVGRYSLHDLIRQHARIKVASAQASERDDAAGRLLQYYLGGARAAEAVLSRQSRARPSYSADLSPVHPALPDLAAGTSALAWARAERSNLLACLDHMTATGQHAQIVALTAAVASLLRLDVPWTDAIARHAAAARAARHVGDGQGEARALSDLGDISYLAGDYERARAAQQQALDTYRDLGDGLGQANALNDLGVVQEHIGNYPEAAEALNEAVNVYRELGDQRGLANTLSNIAVVYEHTGKFQDGAAALGEAEGIYRDLGMQIGLANTLIYLAAVWRMTGQYRKAIEALEEALLISGDLNHRLIRANALTYLGAVRECTFDYPAATEALKQALEIYEDLGQQLGRANALTFLGAVRERTGDYPAADEALALALDTYRRLGDRGGEAQALNTMGTLYRVRGFPDEAIACHQQALTLSEAIHSAWDEAHARAGLGRCAYASGDCPAARDYLLQAQVLFERLGTPEANGIVTELEDLDSEQ